MIELSDYNEETSIYELFEFLYNKVITRKITRFSQLIEYAHKLPKNKTTDQVYRKLFHLMRELNWGVFARLDPERFPSLWKQLVVANTSYSGTGDLKRNTSISSVYTAILDIHGYSAFCQKHRRNLSMIELLDECIQNDIHRICENHQTLSWRSEGDAIVLIAASARHILTAILNIVDYFSKRRVLNSREIVESRVLNKIALPEMAVSAGIAGGRNYTPMVITHDGNISGDIVNTAARLQAFANTLDPSGTRILTTNHVAHQLKKIRPEEKSVLLQSVDYFFLGRFQFKGMELTVFELLYHEKQKKKMQYQKSIVRLYNSLRKQSWRDQVFSSLADGLSKVFDCCESPMIGGKSREDWSTQCTLAKLNYQTGTDYRHAISLMRQVCRILPKVSNADPVLGLYAEKILQVYEAAEARFYDEMEATFENALNRYLDLAQRDNYLKTRKSGELHQKMKEQGLRVLMSASQKSAWHRNLEANEQILNQHIYVGKK